jgi:tetratricopeptide (TPR) repeat protein
MRCLGFNVLPRRLAALLCKSCTGTIRQNTSEHPICLSGVELYESGREAEALPLLEKEASAEVVPGLACLYYGVAMTEYKKDANYIFAAEEKVGEHLDSDFVLMATGAVLWRIGLKIDGVERMRRAIDLNPSCQNLHVCASHIYRENEYADEALKYYDMILAEYPNDAEALMGRGYYLAHKAMYSQSATVYDKVTHIDSVNAMAYHNLGCALAEQGKYREALSPYFKAVCLKFGYEAYAGVAYCFLKMGRLRKASRYAKRTLRMAPDYDNAKEMLKEIAELKATRSLWVRIKRALSRITRY